MRFIHISDLHYSRSKSHDIGLVCKALLKDIENERAKGAFDFVFFTGDLVDRGTEEDDFLDVILNVIDDIVKVSGIPADRFILCPGNHDLSQVSFKNMKSLDAGLEATLNGVAALNTFLGEQMPKGELLGLSLEPLKNFCAFEGMHYSVPPETPSPLTRVVCHEADGKKIAICSFNTAWRSTAGSGNDRLRLLIGEKNIDLALQSTEDADLRIALMHHPLDWLADFDRNAIEPRLYQSFDFLLFGHVHTPRPDFGVSPLGGIIRIQAGSLFSSRDAYCGYNIVDVNFEESRARVHLRVWSDYAREFVADLQSAPKDGKITLDLPKPQKDEGQVQLRRLLRFARRHIRTLANEHVTLVKTKLEGDDDIKEVFVCPPLTRYRQGEQASEIAAEVDATVDVFSLLTQPPNIAIFGRQDVGKTSLGHLIAVSVSEGISDIPRVPAILKAKHLKGYENSLIALVRDYLTPERPDYANLSDLESLFPSIKAFPLFLIIDDFDIQDEKQIATIKALQKLRPLDRWLLLCGEESAVIMLGGSQKKATNELNDFDCLYLQDLPRRAIREISMRRNELREDELVQIFPYIMDNLESAGLPRNGYIVSLLAWMAAKGIQQESINEAVLIKYLIDHLLERGNFRDAIRGSFDPEVKEILLSELALFFRNKSGGVSLNDTVVFVSEYFERKQWAYEADKVVRGFLDCRLLEVRGGKVDFRFACYREYFVARYLADNPSVLAEVASTRRFADYARELDLLTSLARRDHNLIRQIIDEMTELEKGAVKIEKIEYYPFCEQKIVVEVLGPPLRELKKKQLTQNQIDDLSDRAERDLTIRSETDAGEKKSEEEFVITREYSILLSLLGKLTRNSEALDGAAKAAAIKEYVHRAAKLIGYSVWGFGKGAESLKKYSDLKDLNLTKEEAEAFISLLQIWTPEIYTSLMYDEIGTKKLLGTINILIDDGTTQLDQRVLLNLVVLKLSVLDGLTILEKILATTKNRFVLLVYHSALTSVFRMRQFESQAEKPLEDAIADIEIRLGYSKLERPFLLERLRRDKLVRLFSEGSSKKK